MTLVYATATDYETYAGLTPGTAPAGTDRRLAHASRLVTRALQHDLYDVDATGLPTDTDEAAAMRDATCAHALAATTADLDTDAGAAGVTPTASSSSVGTASVAYDTTGTTSSTEARTALLSTLTLDALLILREAGLGQGQPGRAW